MLARPDAIERGYQSALKMFVCMDTKKDGVESAKEFKAFVQAIGVSDSSAESAFKMIDGNGNGVLSKEEGAEACACYYFDKEPSLGLWPFWGVGISEEYPCSLVYFY